MRVIADPDPGRGDRSDRGRHPSLVHILDRSFDRPGKRRRLQERAHLVDELRRGDVMVSIDAVSRHLDLLRADGIAEIGDLEKLIERSRPADQPWSRACHQYLSDRHRL